MTDLHCHILPGMDDGAKDTAVSLELLHREYEDGVRNIAFTSHFNSERTTVDAFTAKRQAAFEQLTAALEGQPMQFDFKLGAEVFFSPGLCELDTRALCMGDTAYLLLEFPTTHKPHFIRQTLYNLQQRGIVPLVKSSNSQRMKENLDIFDFTLSENEMEQIATLDTGHTCFAPRNTGASVTAFLEQAVAG